MKQDFHVPDIVAKYVTEHDGVNLAVNWNSAGADGGYVHMVWHSVVLSKLTRTCHRCGYDPLWKPNDDDSRCQRHTYGPWRYDDVFAWSDFQNPLSLEECFEDWLSKQPTRWDVPAEFISYGRFGYR